VKLATFVDPACMVEARLGVICQPGVVDIVSVAHVLNRPVPACTVKAALTSGPSVLEAVHELAEAAEQRGLVLPLDRLRLLPPIPDPSKFLCLGKNSQAHREEIIASNMMTEMPNEPTGFIKLVSTLCGQDSEIVRPAGISSLDYEPELVFVIGKRALGVTKVNAAQHVAGITLFNDITAREIQKREAASGTRFWTAKNMPNFAPIGPFVATLDEVADVDNLWITCHVNGSRRLRENTSNFIYKIADVIDHFSRYLPLEAGDIIAMGAPSGVAMGQPNPMDYYLRPGDRVEVAIEGLMSLRNTIVAPPAH
jgi:2-keto-4-pentenoate hydratase/2-oxohepta-3-ene-1,7-dioic acid hydratase in catechol pathway